MLKKINRIINELDIEIIESSGEGIPLFLFHGNSGSADNFLFILNSHLGSKFKLIAVSFPGHGNSSPSRKPIEDYTIESLGAFAVDLINSFNFESYFIYGHSLGGHAVLEALSRFKGLSGIILSSAPPISLSTMEKAFKPDPTNGALFSSTLTEHQIDQFVKSLSSTRINEYPKLVSDIIKTDPAFRESLGQSISEGLVKDEVEACCNSKIPIALLASSSDEFLSLDYILSVKFNNLWNGSAQIINESGHLLPVDSPDEIANLIDRFITEAVHHREAIREL